MKGRLKNLQLCGRVQKVIPEITKYPLMKIFVIHSRRNDWILTADSTWGEGYSTGTLKESPSKGKSLFSGEIVTRYL